MTEAPDNMVSLILQRIELRLSKIEEKLTNVVDNTHEMSIRLAHVEENLAGVHRRQDRFDARLDRIEKRLELNGSPYGGVHE
jgi:DNA repair ATPase RecN